MKECICSTCANLREEMGEEGPTGDFACVHGYPGEDCENCETGECDLECVHWMDADAEPGTVTVLCSACGREMQADATDIEEGAVYCVDCYLKRTL